MLKKLIISTGIVGVSLFGSLCYLSNFANYQLERRDEDKLRTRWIRDDKLRTTEYCDGDQPIKLIIKQPTYQIIEDKLTLNHLHVCDDKKEFISKIKRRYEI